MHLRKFLRLSGSVLALPALNVCCAPFGQSTSLKSNAFGPLVNLADFEELARHRLSHMAYEYIAGGAGDEMTMRWNREALEAIRLNPRVLVDVQPVDMSVTLFGQKHATPILLAPTAFHRLAHREGEVETARGASAAGVGFVVSSLSTRRLEDIARVTSQPLWFQLFVLQKERRDFVREVLAEAKARDCRAIVLTVDAPVTGARNRSERAHFHLPDAWETPYYPDRSGRKQSGGLPISGALTWSDVDWLRANTDLPVLLKGILNPADAKQAVRAGVNGIVVSNHGGRELDTVPASITMLPKIVEAVEDRIPVLMDSGIRRGTDILKALALGAKAVLVGRPYLYGLACNGAPGVSRVIEILRKELEMAMVLTGRQRVADINRSVVG
jgi:4-hydroxymandelate oxidase